jgi:hypothetical protein
MAEEMEGEGEAGREDAVAGGGAEALRVKDGVRGSDSA